MKRSAWESIPQKKLVTIETKERCWHYFRLSEDEAIYRVSQVDVRRIGNMGAEWFGCEGSIVRCINPGPGVVYLFRFRHVSTSKIIGWDALIFDGVKWFRPDWL